NDMPLAVEALRRALEQSPKHRVAWVAGDGKEAVARCTQDLPDLILMDLIMPEVDGVEATRRIMGRSPCPILVVTSTVAGNAGMVFEALGAGALDAVNTPVLGLDGDPNGAATLLAKIDMIGRLMGTRSTRSVTPAKAAGAASSLRPLGLVAIGSSAGGPAALASLLARLPRDFPAAIVIVQHVDEQFAAGLAEWLCDHSTLPVRLARPGDKPVAGGVLLAGTSDHLIFTGPDTLGYTPEPRDLVYRPSVDVFFESILRQWKGAVTGVLLTGMGRDGAAGLKALRDAGHHTVAQDRATCAVYGMPKAAAALNAAVEVLPLDQIGPALQSQFVSGLPGKVTSL
ncbi:MAG TPA: chemotaxis response regulator protein-glutamate methylesterase, partial [Verrucomicrobiae bacterium]|nr:chemotaxis response regulator protein-glutamate methylesterase [Verrucomicrobiae bacterium]